MRCSLTRRTLHQTLLALFLLCGGVAAQAGIIGSVLGTVSGAVNTATDALYMTDYVAYRTWETCMNTVGRDTDKKICGKKPPTSEGFDQWYARLSEQQKREQLKILNDGRPGTRFRLKKGGPGKGPGPLSEGAVLPHPPGY